MFGRIPGVLAAIALAATVGACNSATKLDTKWADPATITYYHGLHVNLARMTKTASGVFYWDSIPGKGTYQVRPGDQLTVQYTLWLPDGTQVDAGTFGPFPLSTSNVIPGWVDGLSGAVQGATRQLLIPPALGYGDAGNQGVPGNSTLVFLVTVNQVIPASGDLARVDAIAAALEGSGAAARFRRQAARFR